MSSYLLPDATRRVFLSNRVPRKRAIVSSYPRIQRSLSRQQHPSFVLVTGGARSGKSRFALQLAHRWGARIVYIATCCPDRRDRELAERIALHRNQRPASWQTIEHPADLPLAVSAVSPRHDGIIVDCLTMYVAELSMQQRSDRAIVGRVRRLCRAMRDVPLPTVMVTNEVGCGVVPSHAMGRRFRDLAGTANQIAAEYADQVVWMVSGLAVPIKGDGVTANEVSVDA